VKNLGWVRRAIVSFSFVPLDLITWLAFAMVALSFVAIVVQVVLRLVVPDAVPKGFTTVLILVLFIGGIQLLCLSIIGSYLAHMYEESKSRPAYIVEEIINPPSGGDSEPPAPTS
jgi:dolichol-phosphate mannosyltransferase